MLNNFFGFRLNTAGVVIGWVGAIWSAFVIVLFAIGLSRLDELAKYFADMINDPQVDQISLRNLFFVVLIISITINAINLAASALLIAGTVKERHLLLVPWLLNCGISLLFGGIYIISFIVQGVSAGAPFGSIAFPLISTIIGLVFQFYIWYAIYSLYKQIQSTRDLQQRLIPATSSSYPSYTKI